MSLKDSLLQNWSLSILKAGNLPLFLKLYFFVLSYTMLQTDGIQFKSSKMNKVLHFGQKEQTAGVGGK